MEWFLAFDPAQKLVLIKVVGVVVPLLFLPLTALTYHRFRHHRQQAEIDRVIGLLRFDDAQRRIYEQGEPGWYFAVAVLYTTLLTACGLTLLFLTPELEGTNALIGFAEPGGEATDPAPAFLPFLRHGSVLIFAVGFLGAYVWGIQYVTRRYVATDLTPSVYHVLSARILVASITALILFNAVGALTGGDNEPGGITSMIWLGLAFLIGTFPQRGVKWLTERVPMLGEEQHPAVREAPLEMIEGLTTYDRMRLQEEDVDTCYDLANKDFVPLILHTPYSARELIDWILQAKLCAYFGDAVVGLREHGIRTVLDLLALDDADLEELSKNTACTKLGLVRAQQATRDDAEIQRLREIGMLLGRFWRKEDEQTAEFPLPDDLAVPGATAGTAGTAPVLPAKRGDGEPSETAPPAPEPPERPAAP